MRPRRLLTVLAALLLLPGALSAQGLELLPSTKVGRPEPLWVSADRARTVAGTLDQNLFSHQEFLALQRELDLYDRRRAMGRIGEPGDPCKGAGYIIGDYHIPEPTLAELVGFSQIILTATVVQGEEGFYRGSPARLFEVTVEEVLQGTALATPGQTLYVSLQDAQIQVAGGWLCSRWPRYPERPQVGKRLLLFLHEIPTEEQPIVSPMDEQIFFETKDVISAPDHLVEQLESPAFDDLEEEVKRLVAQRSSS